MKDPHEPVLVSTPDLPDFEDYVSGLQKIWNSRQLSNYGSQYQQFVAALKTYIGSSLIEVVNNGTVGLFQLLCNLVDRRPGKVITTPYSFPATAQAIRLAGYDVAYADIGSKGFNLDPDCVESLIDDQTRAIVPVHVYGVPCDVDAFESLGKRYSIPILYDAAHCFGASFRNQSLVCFGDASMVSFHATKILHTIEGGMIWVKDPDRFPIVRSWGNFSLTKRGFAKRLGFNSKLNEFACLMGLLLLPRIAKAIEHRRQAFEIYRHELAGLAGLEIHSGHESIPDLQWNYQYLPIMLHERSVYRLQQHLTARGILTRRYFWPLCSDIPGARQRVGIQRARKASNSVLCLPISSVIDLNQVKRVCAELKNYWTTSQSK